MAVHILYGDSYMVSQAFRRLVSETGGDSLFDANQHQLQGNQVKLPDLLAVANALPFLDTQRLIVVQGLLGTLEGRPGRRRNSRQDSGGRGVGRLGPGSSGYARYHAAYLCRRPLGREQPPAAGAPPGVPGGAFRGPHRGSPGPLDQERSPTEGRRNQPRCRTVPGGPGGQRPLDPAPGTGEVVPVRQRGQHRRRGCVGHGGPGA